MKKYYIILIISLVAIFSMQAINIYSLHENFMTEESARIEKAIFQAIDLELHHRGMKNKSNVKYASTILDVDNMPKAERERFLAKHPKPTHKPICVEHDINSLFDKNRIRSKADIMSQRSQDEFYREGRYINLNILDSLFDIRLGRGYDNKLTLTNNKGDLLGYKEDGSKYNRAFKPIIIGLEDNQIINLEVYIPTSSFVKKSISITIVTFLIILIPIITLLYFITTLRRRDKELKLRALAINGTIHDLKSPLASVNALLDYFSITKQEPRVMEIININRTTISFLADEINSILYTAKSGKFTPNKQTVSSNNIAESVEQILKSLPLRHKDKDINYEIIDNVNQNINIDNLQFGIIANNLIENGVKYSGDSVKITVLLELTDENTFTVKITDNGYGIDKKHQIYIFNNFYRVENNNKQSGYGIGLYYCKEIARSHGGNIYLDWSKLGIGSCFVVKLNIN